MRRTVLAVAVMAAAVASAREPWGLPELEAAAAQGAWSEVLERCEDVTPPARTERWRALVADAAAVALEKTTAPREKPFAVAERAQALAARHAHLEKSARFSAAREKAVQTAISACVEADASDCLLAAKAHVGALGGPGALEAARTVRRGEVATSAMPLVARAVTAQASLCTDPLISEVVLASLELPREDSRAAAAREVAFEKCWNVLGPALKQAQVGASRSMLANACQAMRTRKALSELQDDLCRDEGL